jgi:hypothetical protein
MYKIQKLSNLSKGTDHSVPLLTAAIEFSLALLVTHVLYTRLSMLRHYFSTGTRALGSRADPVISQGASTYFLDPHSTWNQIALGI